MHDGVAPLFAVAIDAQHRFWTALAGDHEGGHRLIWSVIEGEEGDEWSLCAGAPLDQVWVLLGASDWFDIQGG